MELLSRRILGEPVTPEDEPLHVQVARALGWTDMGPHESAFGVSVEWLGIPPGKMKQDCQGDWPEVPDYVVDGWAEILEREQYCLFPLDNVWYASEPDDLGYAEPGETTVGEDLYLTLDGTMFSTAMGDTPGEAVCRLYVKLKGAK